MLEPSPHLTSNNMLAGRAATSLAELRERSLKTVELVFAWLVVVCAIVGGGVHQFGAYYGMPDATRDVISYSFLGLALTDVVLMYFCRLWLSRRVDY